MQTLQKLAQCLGHVLSNMDAQYIQTIQHPVSQQSQNTELTLYFTSLFIPITIDMCHRLIFNSPKKQTNHFLSQLVNWAHDTVITLQGTFTSQE